MPNEPASLDIPGVAIATGEFDGLDRFSGIVFLGNALDKFLIAFTTLSEHVTEIQEFCPEHFDGALAAPGDIAVRWLKPGAPV